MVDGTLRGGISVKIRCDHEPVMIVDAGDEIGTKTVGVLTWDGCGSYEKSAVGFVYNVIVVLAVSVLLQVFGFTAISVIV